MGHLKFIEGSSSLPIIPYQDTSEEELAVALRHGANTYVCTLPYVLESIAIANTSYSVRVERYTPPTDAIVGAHFANLLQDPDPYVQYDLEPSEPNQRPLKVTLTPATDELTELAVVDSNGTIALQEVTGELVVYLDTIAPILPLLTNYVPKPGTKSPSWYEPGVSLVAYGFLAYEADSKTPPPAGKDIVSRPSRRDGIDTVI